MNLHKDKERLRHQRQVKLLDDVMKIVPRPLNDSASKVRKLRHLALYYHFMQKVHAQITKGHSNIIKGSKKSPNKTPVKLAQKSLKVHCTSKKKPQRANIVFLQVERSKTEVENIFYEPTIKENGNSAESPCAKKIEYKVPEIVMVNEVDDSNATFNHNPCLPVENIMPIHSNNSSSSSEVISQLDLASEDNYNAGKENHSPLKANLLINNLNDQVIKQFEERISENINNENLTLSKCRKTDFQNILQDYSNNSTLRDLSAPDITSENVCVTDINYPEQDSNYVLEILPFENVSGYPINLPSRDVILTSNNLNCKALYALDSSLVHSQLQSVPSLPEILSDNCSSSTITDNLHIDVENLSDSSNEVNKTKATNINDKAANNDNFYSPNALVYEFPHGTLMNYDDYILPIVSSSYNCLDNYNEQNEISSRPMGYLPHFDTISPNSVSFNEGPTVIQCFEPIHSFQERLVEPRFITDNVTFYSPTFIENFSSGRSSLLNTKLEIKAEPDSQDVFFKENKSSGLFEEEVSYPLSQFINNY